MMVKVTVWCEALVFKQNDKKKHSERCNVSVCCPFKKHREMMPLKSCGVLYQKVYLPFYFIYKELTQKYVAFVDCGCVP